MVLLALSAACTSTSPTPTESLNPEALRFRVTANATLGLEPTEHLALASTIGDPGSSEEVMLEFEVEDRARLTEPEGLFAESEQDVMVLRLTRSSIAAFRAAQQRVSNSQRASFHASLAYDDEGILMIPEPVFVSLAVRLAEGRQFVTIIDRYPVNPQQATNRQTNN